MLEKFLPRQDFSSYEDFKENYKVVVPEGFNFAYDVVDEWARQDDHKPALAWLDDASDAEVVEYSFGDMMRMSNQAANMFKAHGIRKGDVVLMILKQRVEVWVSMLALHKIGAVVIPGTFLLTEEDISYRANSADVKMILAVTEPVITQHVINALPECKTVQFCCGVGDSDLPDGWVDFRKEVKKYSPEWTKPTGDDYAGMHDPMLIYFTSGTSGYPKMILHDFTYPLGHIVTAKYWQQLEDGQRHMTSADSGWAKFAWGKIYGQWLCGAVIAVYDVGQFTAAKMCNAISKLKLNSFCAPPTVYRFLIKEDLSQYDFSGIKHCSIAGEPLNPEVYYQWLKLTGLHMVEGLGQTESSVLIANFPWFPVKPGSTGKFSPLYDLDIVDENGKSCEDGVVGSIVVRHARSRRPTGLFREYYRNEAAMQASWAGDDYNTGDMAWRDAEGYIWFEGRNDDVIKCSGYRIGPFEVESVLMEHPCVLECAVTAYPDPIRGEVVKATIVLAPNRGFTPGPELIKELQTFVKKTTAPYKYPRVIEFVDKLPKSISGKINRKRIREMDLEKLSRQKQ